MKQLAVISLCDFTGNMVKPWADQGLQCYCVDIQHSIRNDRVENNIHYVWGDCRSWTPPENVQPIILFAFPPCTHLASSGARDFQKKDWNMLRDGMDLFMACMHAGKWSGVPYMVENPIGRISGLHHQPEYIFDPCDYGNPYTKKTCVWAGNGFVMPPKNRVEPTKGSMMHTMPENKARTILRSKTPEGFANAVFKVNNS